jgi:8-oxo-dGTP pyrophosphatase MutT (NUDIX family)
MTNDNPWKTVSSKTVYENPWIRVREDNVVRPDGTSGIYGVMESNDSVMTIALNEKNEVFLIRAFSYPVSSWSWELPGGGGDNEHAEIAAKRELAEETGIVAQTWTSLGKTRVCNGLMTERTHYYVASDIEIQERIESDDHHFISDGQFYSLNRIDEMIISGDIDDGQTITGLYLLKKYIQTA